MLDDVVELKVVVLGGCAGGFRDAALERTDDEFDAAPFRSAGRGKRVIFDRR